MKKNIKNRILKFKDLPIENYVTEEFLKIYSKQIEITNINEDNISILELYLINCNITNFKPFEILLEKLQKLILQKNNLNSKILKTIVSENITHIDLSNNNFEIFPEIKCPNISFLDISKNKLKKIPINFLKDSKNLKSLDLCNLKSIQ